MKPEPPASGDKKQEYVYDYLGRRMAKWVYMYSGGGRCRAKQLDASPFRLGQNN